MAQADLLATVGPIIDPAGRRAGLLDRMTTTSGVRTRHLALELDRYPGLGDFGARNDMHRTLGTRLAARAARTALSRAGVDPGEVDVLFLTSVTGVSAPSVDALLVAELGLRTDVVRTPSFGLGCAGGAAGLGRVHDALGARPRGVGLLVSLELCSLTLQRGDDSPASVVAAALFGDGAAAAVLVGDEHPLASRGGLQVAATLSRLHPGTDGVLGWDIGATGFRIVLSPGLPDLVEAHLATDLAALLAPHGLGVDGVDAWVVHAGGPRILDAVTKALGLPGDALDVSRASLAEAGNLSSASVLDVLARSTARARPAGWTAVVLAFGPGVSVEAVLLRQGLP